MEPHPHFAVGFVVNVIALKVFGVRDAFAIGAAAVLTAVPVVGAQLDAHPRPPSSWQSMHIPGQLPEAEFAQGIHAVLAKIRTQSFACDGSACWRVPPAR